MDLSVLHGIALRSVEYLCPAMLRSATAFEMGFTEA